MDEHKLLTAKEAKSLTEANQTTSTLEMILSGIKLEAEGGSPRYILFGSISDDVRSRLKELGYTLELHKDDILDPFYRITW